MITSRAYIHSHSGCCIPRSISILATGTVIPGIMLCVPGIKSYMFQGFVGSINGLIVVICIFLILLVPYIAGCS